MVKYTVQEGLLNFNSLAFGLCLGARVFYQGSRLRLKLSRGEGGGDGWEGWGSDGG